MGAFLVPAHALYFNVSGHLLFTIIPLIALCIFTWTVFRRIRPLLSAMPDPRFDHPVTRLASFARYWFLQWKHPRYRVAGILHIIIFAGFLVLSLRSLSLVLIGLSSRFDETKMLGRFASVYDIAVPYTSTFVFIAVAIAAIRRVVFRPFRYAPRVGDTRHHTAEALTVLCLIALLMVSESIFGADGQNTPRYTIAHSFAGALAAVPPGQSHSIRLYAYLIHELTFFVFLCVLPFGKHFHVLTSAFNIYFARLKSGQVKPARWGTDDGALDKLPTVGVRVLHDFTWKHILDFYSCADCGRCSDNCPAHAAGRPLSPRFLTIKARDLCFEAFPVFSTGVGGLASIGPVYSEDEIWSCTTCGACEQECPMQIEYIDKIVDLRRALVEDGHVPASVQKALKSLESRGNPYGKLEKKRADWTKTASVQAKTLSNQSHATTLFFVDSVSSYDERIQQIARATASLLALCGEDFGILGASESDSGHDVRRFGEEALFQELRETNSNAIRESGVTKIVTADPHAFNALRHDYNGLPPVEHISQFLSKQVVAGHLELVPAEDEGRVVVYHDPCYLGRHNQIYAEPRLVLDAIPGITRREMKKCRDRSFCCGGGGLMLNYEAPEKQRIGSLRLNMALETGADTIVTACPFCLINLEDAIKVAGVEKQMRVMDLTELVLQHSQSPLPIPSSAPAADSLVPQAH